MNKVILRFLYVKNGKVFEVIFDTRLSFKENFNLLKEIYDIDKDSIIVDPDRGVLLNRDTSLKYFNFPNFMTLYLY